MSSLRCMLDLQGEAQHRGGWVCVPEAPEEVVSGDLMIIIYVSRRRKNWKGKLLRVSVWCLKRSLFIGSLRNTQISWWAEEGHCGTEIFNRAVLETAHTGRHKSLAFPVCTCRWFCQCPAAPRLDLIFLVLIRCQDFMCSSLLNLCHNSNSSAIITYRCGNRDLEKISNLPQRTQ